MQGSQTMKNRKIPNELKDFLSQMSDALLPSIEELGDEERRTILEASGLDEDSVIQKAHHALQELAGRKYLSQGKRVPPQLREALLQLKPAGPRERIELETGRARATIRSIFDEVKQNTAAILNPRRPASRLEPAFRNKKDMSEADRKQLDELQEELDRNDASS